MKNKNNEIDRLLQIRQDGILNYASATKSLSVLGVKIGKQETGDIDLPNSFKNHIEQYERSNMEFEWEVEYIDGKILKQFAPKDHCFKDIDISSVKKVRWISNFEWPTENVDKRIIVELNFEDGKFAITNGFISQEDIGKLYKKEYIGDKKLILFTRKRYSSTTGSVPVEYSDLIPSTSEFFMYNKFFIGYEVPGEGVKRVLEILPTGHVGVCNA